MVAFAYGPVELYLVGLENERPAPGVVDALAEVLDAGLVRLLDLVLISRDENGNLTVIEIEEGRVVFGGTPDESVYNPIGTVHGGNTEALNHFLDRDLDARMPRTARRPLPSGRIRHPWHVVALGLGLVMLAVSLALWQLNRLVALHVFLGAFTYVVVYTIWLKRRSWLNVVIGGLAGSFAVLAGGALAHRVSRYQLRRGGDPEGRADRDPRWLRSPTVAGWRTWVERAMSDASAGWDAAQVRTWLERRLAGVDVHRGTPIRRPRPGGRRRSVSTLRRGRHAHRCPGRHVRGLPVDA